MTACPLLTLKIHKEKVIKKFMENIDFQSRKEFPRKRPKFSQKYKNTNLFLINQKFSLENEELCKFSFKIINNYEFSGNKYLDKVEEAQDMLASIFSFQDPNSSSIKDEGSLNDFDRQIGNSLLIYGDEESKTDLKITTSPLMQKTIRVPHRKLTYHSPLLPKIYEEKAERSNQEKEKEREKEKEDKSISSQKSFQSKHLLRIETQQNIKINNSSETILSSRFSPTTEKLIDLFELSLLIDSMKCYKSYFPHNNADVVIKKINYDRARGDSEKKTRRKKYWKKSRIISSKISQNTSLKMINSYEEFKK